MDLVNYLDGLCLDIHGHIVETTAAIIFWVRCYFVYAFAKNAGVSGVFCRIILEYAQQLNFESGER